jgi:hypothetical protein
VHGFKLQKHSRSPRERSNKNEKMKALNANLLHPNYSYISKVRKIIQGRLLIYFLTMFFTKITF